MVIKDIFSEILPPIRGMRLLFVFTFMVTTAKTNHYDGSLIIYTKYLIIFVSSFRRLSALLLDGSKHGNNDEEVIESMKEVTQILIWGMK